MASKYTVDDMKKLARRNEGHFLSETYNGVKHKHHWSCTEGHKWMATPDSIIQGSWCPECANKRGGTKNRKYTLDFMREFAKSKGGQFLSNSYSTTMERYSWQCQYGHVWEQRAGHILDGHWCPECGGSFTLTLEKMQEVAKTRGGKCLSKQYINARTKLKWECSEGHRWEAIPDNVVGGTWCGKCLGRNPTIEDMRTMAESKGGKCLSSEYIDSQSKLTWQCSEGHQWEAVPSSVTQGHWCEICSSLTSERICRAAFEQIFSVPFKKTKPIWLLNSRKNRMELDGYSPALNIAFEHQGTYHTEIVYPNQTKEQLHQRIKDDRLKAILCKQHGIKLVGVPQILGNVKLEEVQEFIGELCQKNDIVLPESFESTKIDFSSINTPGKLEEIRKFAKEKGGECLSDYYLGSDVKLEFKCQNSHVWSARPSNIKRGVWCPHCAKKAPHTIEQMKELAAERGGECLSTEYVNAKTKLSWAML